METTNTIQNGINELLSVSADDALARTFAAYVNKNCRMIGVFVDWNIEQAQNLLELFCATVWKMEEKGQSKSFELLSLVMKSLLPNVKRQILPQLIAQSKMYAALALLARELFDSYSKEERHNFKLPMIYWTTTDKHTDITEAEYLWRQNIKNHVGMTSVLQGSNYFAARWKNLMFCAFIMCCVCWQKPRKKFRCVFTSAKIKKKHESFLPCFFILRKRQGKPAVIIKAIIFTSRQSPSG